MAKPLVNHIKTALDTMFDGKIDMSDVRSTNADDIKRQFYSRALAAYSLHILASIPVEEAGKAITDSYDDNGIDAIYHDEHQKMLYLVQSKMIEEGVGEPETGDMRKFKDGVIDLIQEKYDRFNSKTLTKLETIKDAFSDSQIKLNLVIAYTGKGFAPHNTRIIDDVITELNDSTEWAYFTDFNLKTAHDALNTVLAGKPIEAEVTLSNWGTIDEPFTAYYGQISAHALATLWKNHRKKLFTENIRNFIGLSDINTGILKTIETEPDKFIYFNNGVTILCNTITPVPARTIGKSTGLFNCKGLTIINGAQTVGSLGVALDKFPDKLELSKVFVRLVPLEHSPTGFGNRITIASNTQNRVEKRDFVTLDPEQHRIRTELLLQKIHYHFKRTDEVISYDENNCTLEEATVALACATKDSTYAVTAKREIGRLWEDVTKPPYRDLFNEQLRVHKLWRCIQVFRKVSKYLNDVKEGKTGRERSIYTYGNYFILNIVINEIPTEIMMNPNSNFSNFFDTELQHIIINVSNKTLSKTQEKYSSALVHQLFRNYTKCKDLREEIQKDLLREKENTEIVSAEEEGGA